MKIKIVGLDPSLTNTGIAMGEYDTVTGKYTISCIQLVETEKNNSKQIRRNSDDLVRAYAISKRITEVTADATFVFSEIPTGSQSHRASMAFGMVIGMLAGIMAANPTKWRLIQVMPTEVKQNIPGGSKNTSKEEIIDWAVKQFPNLSWIKHSGKLVKKNEHIADAIGVINAGVKTDDFLNAISILSVRE